MNERHVPDVPDQGAVGVAYDGRDAALNRGGVRQVREMRLERVYDEYARAASGVERRARRE